MKKLIKNKQTDIRTDIDAHLQLMHIKGLCISAENVPYSDASMHKVWQAFLSAMLTLYVMFSLLSMMLFTSADTLRPLKKKEASRIEGKMLIFQRCVFRLLLKEDTKLYKEKREYGTDKKEEYYSLKYLHFRINMITISQTTKTKSNQMTIILIRHIISAEIR
uniref:Uncharacterized protein n=1 Tax=Glossina brevipalpis TaxID=37001 RepID=A0A1A9W672_9MUSC